MIELKNINKKYGKKVIFEKLNLKIPNGIFGLLGENGSGKTTLLNIIASVSKYEGEVITKDKDINYLPQNFNFFENLTTIESIKFFKELKEDSNKKKSEYLVEILELQPYLNYKVKDLSGGTRQRLGILQAFLGESKIILLDEPTVGLDPSQRINFFNLVSSLTTEDMTVIISSHILSDIYSLCENIGIIKRGEIIFNDSLDNFINKFNEETYETIIDLEELSDFKNQTILSIRRYSKQVKVKYIGKKYRNMDKKVEANFEDIYYYFCQKVKL